MTITKFRDIMHRSGSAFIKTPGSLALSHCIVNVQNKDNLCFLYSILAIQKYAEITDHHHCRVNKYKEYLPTLNYKEEWFPMKLKDIPKFEKVNPTFGVNVLIVRDKIDTNEIHYKNPNVDIVYRSKNEGT